MISELSQPNLNPAFLDLKQVTDALERTARRTRKIAAQTGTELIVGTPSMQPAVPAQKPASDRT